MTPSAARACVAARASRAAALGAGHRRSTRSPNTARRCRTATRPSCGKRAARSSGSSRAGPNKVSLEQCDLGLGPGVVKGAYAQLPRYFADADRVMDLETRLVWCMVDAAGLSARPTRSKNPFGAARPQVRHRGARRLRHVRVARREDERLARRIRKEREAYRARREDVLLPRRPARLRAARPATARTASASGCRTCRTSRPRKARRRPTRPGRRTASRRASCARSSGGSTTASASSAFPSSCSAPTRRSR